MKIVLACEEAAGKLTLQMLEECGLRPLAVLTDSAPALGTGPAALAGALGIPVLPAASVRDPAFAATLRAEGADLLLNVHSLHLIHPKVVKAPRIGSFNLHPGPLPAYAGLNAPSWAILAGETAHAVTLHWVDGGIDTGPVAYEAAVPITEGDTGLRLSMRCVQKGIPLLRRLIDDAHATPHRIPALPQPDGRRCCHGREAPDNGNLDWHQPAHRIERLVRAFDYTPLPSPWGRLTAYVGQSAIEIRKVARTRRHSDAPPGTLRRTSDAVEVAAADEWVRLLAVGCAGAALSLDDLPEGARLTPAPSPPPPHHTRAQPGASRHVR